MCGRFYVDDETEKEIAKIVRQVNKRINHMDQNRDVYPTNSATIIKAKNNFMEEDDMVWGFSNYNQKGIIFNARCESVLEKKSFSESVRFRRCLIPAKGFYEWDRAKNKISFERPDKKIMHLAGFWKPFEDEKRFVILTTNANHSMQDVHDRMPLVLETSEIEDWLFHDDSIEKLLQKVPVELEKTDGYVQQSFVF